MKYSHKLSDAIHILTYVSISDSIDNDLSSRAIAGSIESNPSLVRRLMANLSKANLLKSSQGKVNIKLGRSAKEISILDVYKAIEEPDLLHVDPDTNVKCIVGANIQKTLNSAYNKIQKQAESEMDKISIYDIMNDILESNKR
ncbi:Rrf2 family transcriptional regulator [Apilactobacillus apisilvae]|uniref:Rrf2 family transcriptional regulator n=1 Tax=Apilactobacillus apisilvae TaxID=2923364 RepID=A0ABY4PGC2_9LACO|nr:Rrf2 family transcriptional regulator [Apilactobacillus apisilvae]UQS84873.1 Rrf2 family transcriptional regulator [Apilactobacillus apisilvae]